MPANRITWLSPTDPPSAFPRIDTALREPEGLLAAGGDLSPSRLLYAYRQGIFPWYEDGQPLLWWSPDPRCVLFPDEFHVARRLRRDIAASTEIVTFNRSFGDVIRACAEPRPAQHGTWITQDMIEAYEELHALGWAHSIEIRRQGELVGGMYGLVIGRVFFGESMYSRTANASKYALLALVRIASRADFALIDCQVISPHLLTLGARTIPRQEFADIIDAACDPPSSFENWPDGPIPIVELYGNQADT